MHRLRTTSIDSRVQNMYTQLSSLGPKSGSIHLTLSFHGLIELPTGHLSLCLTLDPLTQILPLLDGLSSTQSYFLEKSHPWGSSRSPTTSVNSYQHRRGKQEAMEWWTSSCLPVLSVVQVFNKSSPLKYWTSTYRSSGSSSKKSGPTVTTHPFTETNPQALGLSPLSKAYELLANVRNSVIVSPAYS